jgi:cysteine synthase A
MVPAVPHPGGIGSMDIRDGFLDAIGNTPLIQLRKASAATGCRILGKAEFLNPGGSVKDRAALAIVRDAQAKGRLRPGGIIVEGTAGNTGIGLALVANALGYRTVIVIPETQSQEKKDMLRLCGADLREVAAVPYRDPNNYIHVSERLADELAGREPNGAIWANQFDNVANRQGHIEANQSRQTAATSRNPRSAGPRSNVHSSAVRILSCSRSNRSNQST